jgi:hypothetical protein
MARTRLSIALLTGLVLCAGALAGLSRVQPESKAVVHSNPIVGITGMGSKVKQAGWVRVASAGALRTLWDEHTGAEAGAPQPPTVDFERCVVIAYFEPEVGNASGVRIESIEPYEHGLIVRYDVVQYQTASFGPGEPPPPAKNQPYGFFCIDRSEGDVWFFEDVQSLLNQPPIWQSRWRIKRSTGGVERANPAPRGQR